MRSAVALATMAEAMLMIRPERWFSLRGPRRGSRARLLDVDSTPRCRGCALVILYSLRTLARGDGRSHRVVHGHDVRSDRRLETGRHHHRRRSRARLGLRAALPREARASSSPTSWIGGRSRNWKRSARSRRCARDVASRTLRRSHGRGAVKRSAESTSSSTTRALRQPRPHALRADRGSRVGSAMASTSRESGSAAAPWPP